MSSKFNDAFKALDNIADAVLMDYDQGNLNRDGIKKCCHITDSETEYNFLYRKRVSVAFINRLQDSRSVSRQLGKELENTTVVF